MRTVKDIVKDWKVECGILKTSKAGSYRAIPFEGKRDLLMSLVQTMIDEGYDEKTIKSKQTLNTVCEECSVPEWVDIKSKDRLRNNKITTDYMDAAISEFFHGPISKHVPKDRSKEYIVEIPKEIKEPKAEKAEKVLEINPSDRIQVDTTGYSEMDLDTEFLSELGIDPSFVKGEK